MKLYTIQIRSKNAPYWVKKENRGKFTCDLCGAKLWIAPDMKTKYCDNEHKILEREMNIEHLYMPVVDGIINQK